jgi:high-affinity iron transporter
LLGSYLIGIREGIEAALIISILASYLKKVGEGKRIRIMMSGVAIAVLASILIGLVLSLSLQGLPAFTQENITGVASLVAVGFITWMIFWMAKHSRELAGHLHTGVDRALAGSSLGLIGVAFLSVIREGLETSISLWSASKAIGGDQSSIWGAILGLSSAAVLGYLMYRGSVKIKLHIFFKYTGAYLVILAASIFAYALGEFTESGVITFLTSPSYDVSGIIGEGTVLDVLLRGAFGFMSAPTLLQTIAWVGFVSIVGWFYLKPRKQIVTK